MNREELAIEFAQNNAPDMIFVDVVKGVILSEKSFLAGYDSRQSEIDTLKAEIAEQCRINAMGSERELKLMAELSGVAGKLKLAIEFIDEHKGYAAPSSQANKLLKVISPTRDKSSQTEDK
jgi:hypothetical protein